MKTFKISCRKVKISISHWGRNFQFSARGESYVYLKKNLTPGRISPCLRVTCFTNLYFTNLSIYLFIKELQLFDKLVFN